MGFSSGLALLSLLLLAANPATQTAASQVPSAGDDGEKSDALYFACVQNSHCQGSVCLRVLSDSVSPLIGFAECPSESLCVCGQEWDEDVVAYTVKGDMFLSVSNAAEFVKDVAAKVAMTKAVATLSGVPANYVNVTLALRNNSSRRLDQEEQEEQEWPRERPRRQLEALGSVSVSYTISVPTDDPLGASAAAARARAELSDLASDLNSTRATIAEAVKAEVGGGKSYDVGKVQVSVPSVTSADATSTATRTTTATTTTRTATRTSTRPPPPPTTTTAQVFVVIDSARRQVPLAGVASAAVLSVVIAGVS